MRRLLLVIALALGASVACADDGSFYVGAGISKDKLSDIANQGTNFADIDSTSWKVFAGFRPLSVFAIEADYLDLGSEDSSTHTDAKAFAGYAVGFLPIPVPFLDVFGKAGLSRVKLNGSAVSPLPAVSFSTSGTEFAWGGGAGVHVGNFGARLEYERFNIPNTNGANVASLEVYLNIF
ncbi:MAG TPA: outer membrane beta-barrel protein [Steroidobacteraceae bacterium]|nr:outer membrane beta-barrel protein [Steroidobacteraceae bacterium]